MRHTPEQLHDLVTPLTQNILDALHAALLRAREKQGKRIFHNKRGLFSHETRSQLYDYLRDEPIPGFVLDTKAHRGSIQPVVLRHEESGLVVRFRVFSNFRYEAVPTIPGMDEDSTIAEALFDDSVTGDPGTVLVAWGYPEFDEDGVPGDIPVSVVRLAEGTKLKDQRADCIFPLEGTRSVVPTSSFDPNQAAYIYSGTDEEASGDE